MKTRILLIFSVSSLFLLTVSSRAGVVNDNQITICSTPELKDLTSSWISAYNQQFPGIEIRWNPVDNHESYTDGKKGLAFLSSEDASEVSAWKMAIAREVIVPVINNENPYGYALAERGVSRDEMRNAVSKGIEMNWSNLLGNGQSHPLHVYILSNPAVVRVVSKFLKADNVQSLVIPVESPEKFLRAVSQDPYALGFCDLSSVINPEGKSLLYNLQFLPIDKNADGKLDYTENIYNDPETLLRGAWIGKYPKELTIELFAVSNEKPADPREVAFLSWVLTSGQDVLSQFGYNGLIYSEVQSKLEKIELTPAVATETGDAISSANLILFVLAGLVVIGIVISALFGLGRKDLLEMNREEAESMTSFNERSVKVPAGLYYDKGHSWAFMEQDGSVKVGIDDFMQHVVGHVTRVELKKAGEKVNKGEAFLTLIQKGKKLVMYAPVSGTILETNKALAGDPAALNYAPFSNGWVYRIEPASWLKEMTLMNMADRYSKWLSGEFIRLREFFTSPYHPANPEYAHVVLQDGGELKNNLLEEFGPETWEEFQVHFIDSVR